MIRAQLPDFDGRAPLMPATTPDYLLDAAPAWAARVELEFDKKTLTFDATFYSNLLGAADLGITTQLQQSFTIDPSDCLVLYSGELTVSLDYPGGAWIDIEPEHLAEVRRALLCAELTLNSTAMPAKTKEVSA